MDMVDSTFQSHYMKVKKIKYISNLIHFFSIDFDKRIRKDQYRNLLVLDKSLSNDLTTSPRDLIIDEHNYNITFGNSLLDHIENERLVKALKQLTYKQFRVLEMIYLENYSLKEVADLLQLTPQNISKHHRTALEKIYKYFTRGRVDD
ncbi:sigma-70 family RNA polymerase sigma factor [Virgibacillus salexigens]|uniref:RNA polymerase sigma-70 region 4 domain-containing protein n=1 Tax=Virgibacillus kapii TaxID=1638645 RepID=A0ABQ2DY55_9BACI|nr:sigma-70 family RNA polymerase sigma factor [Virgibacillus kapii]GGJ77097.1 hypothetical protein GCM10007111_43440 [Virgibacillus kapii]